MMNTTMTPLTMDEMAAVAGGHPFEEKFADYSLYRAGITCETVGQLFRQRRLYRLREGLEKDPGG